MVGSVSQIQSGEKGPRMSADLDWAVIGDGFVMLLVKLGYDTEPREPAARDSPFTVRELAEARRTQIEDCGYDRGSTA